MSFLGGKWTHHFNWASRFLKVCYRLYEKVLIHTPTSSSKGNLHFKVYSFSVHIYFELWHIVFLINLTCHYLFLRLCKIRVVMRCEVWIKPKFLESTCYVFWLFWILAWANPKLVCLAKCTKLCSVAVRKHRKFPSRHGNGWMEQLSLSLMYLWKACRI